MKILVPDSPSLVKVIDCTPKLANILWTMLLEALWLLHVDLLFELAIDKGMRDVDGMEMEVLEQG
jgi:hypothetical protein